MKLLFIINTYNRPDEVISVLKKIKGQSITHEVTINLYDDGSADHQSTQILWNINNLESPKFKINYTKFLKPHRKYLYWQLVCHNFHHGIRNCEEQDYYFMLPDDAILPDNYISEATRQWEFIQDKNKICLNTYADKRAGTRCWTSHEPIVKEFSYYKFWLSGWVDMEFICTKRFFEALDYRVRAPHKLWWQINPHRSSGVGMYISYTLFKKGFSMYQVTKSLSKQVKHKSVMQTI